MLHSKKPTILIKLPVSVSGVSGDRRGDRRERLAVSIEPGCGGRGRRGRAHIPRAALSACWERFGGAAVPGLFSLRQRGIDCLSLCHSGRVLLHRGAAALLAPSAGASRCAPTRPALPAAAHAAARKCLLCRLPSWSLLPHRRPKAQESQAQERRRAAQEHRLLRKRHLLLAADKRSLCLSASSPSSPGCTRWRGYALCACSLLARSCWLFVHIYQVVPMKVCALCVTVKWMFCVCFLSHCFLWKCAKIGLRNLYIFYAAFNKIWLTAYI